MSVRSGSSAWVEPFGWLAQHPRTVVLALVAAVSAFPLWRRARRSKNIRLEPLSQRWLAEHEWESGRHAGG